MCSFGLETLESRFCFVVDEEFSDSSPLGGKRSFCGQMYLLLIQTKEGRFMIIYFIKSR